MHRIIARDGTAEPLWPHWLFGLAVGATLGLGLADAAVFRQATDADYWRGEALRLKAERDAERRAATEFADPADGVERIPPQGLPLK